MHALPRPTGTLLSALSNNSFFFSADSWKVGIAGNVKFDETANWWIGKSSQYSRWRLSTRSRGVFISRLLLSVRVEVRKGEIRSRLGTVKMPRSWLLSTIKLLKSTCYQQQCHKLFLAYNKRKQFTSARWQRVPENRLALILAQLSIACHIASEKIKHWWGQYWQLLFAAIQMTRNERIEAQQPIKSTTVNWQSYKRTWDNSVPTMGRRLGRWNHSWRCSQITTIRRITPLMLVLLKSLKYD